jgi:hypothetical protein
MLETLRFYLELAAAQCVTSAGAPASAADYALAGGIGILLVAAIWQFVRGLRGRDGARTDAIKRAILED